MTRRKAGGAPPLFDLDGPRASTRHVKAWERTRRALLAADAMDADRDALTMATLRTLAEAMDAARTAGESWLLARLAAESRTQLEQHTATPGGGGDDLDALLSSLAHPAPSDPAQP